MNKHKFIFPQSSYYGKGTPENTAFNEKLQEFSHKLNYISAFQTAGKIPARLAYIQVEELWQELKQTKEKLDSAK
ncbi:MAG: hypothetical protein F6K40_33390 [Okeania sp. SIO3I5]|uniref:DUF7219 family protein n=1 Tax=Okeania sp. SIO3I5 TaxID=2607805 RepID=UPI0013B6C834|nr:hypothetical protein [Okeania sp. SIO3I5]NEQ40852.1 hypothetical protein [Okeania sp. SIO3I5]